MFNNCPDEYFNDCKNAYLQCKHCSAGEGGNTLKYQPVKGNYRDHPAFKNKKKIEQKQKKQKKQKAKSNSQRTKKALKEEKQVASKIVKETLKSGAIFGDGDYSILEGQIQADHKYKSTQKGFSVTSAEYNKGKTQGTNCWVITNKDKETCFVLTEQAFYSLLATAGVSLDFLSSEKNNNENSQGDFL